MVPEHPRQRAWRVRPVEGAAAAEGIPDLARHLDVPALVAQLLWMRGLRSVEPARRFLSPRLKDLSQPAVLPDIEVAAARLAEAITQGEQIVVCGDYDVDGMTGTALLVRFIRLAKGRVTWWIPDRERDGYGLSADAMAAIAARGAQVAVTVDNGVTAHAALERAAELGVDVIVTDHHLPGETLPPAVALVNPHLAEEPVAAPPCGCTLAFKLAWAVADRLRHLQGGEAGARFKAFLRDAVGLAGIATICDVVPLQGENRILVTAGLGALLKSPHPGIRALLDVAGLGERALTTEDVGFKIGPRLNAAGRLGIPDLVIELLTAEDPDDAARMAKELDDANLKRREIEAAVAEEAYAQAEGLWAERPRDALVLWGEGWHQGVVGIVAARIVDRYHVPATVIGMTGDTGRGSCRTPPGVDLHQALTDCAPHLDRYGGHAQAAGLEIALDRLASFREAFESAVHTQLETPGEVAPLDVDAETRVDVWNLASVQAIRRLAPFGKDNPKPRFLVREAHVAGKPRIMGRAGTHLSFALRQPGGAIRVVAFQRAELYDMAAAGTPLDLVVEPILNEFRGNVSAEFHLVDMRPAQPAAGADGS